MQVVEALTGLINHHNGRRRETYVSLPYFLTLLIFEQGFPLFEFPLDLKESCFLGFWFYFVNVFFGR